MIDHPENSRYLTNEEIEAFYLTFGQPPAMAVTYMSQQEWADMLRRYGGRDEQGVEGRAGGRITRLLTPRSAVPMDPGQEG